MKHQKRNLHDPYAIGLYTNIRGKIETMSLVGHLPREVSRFCKFYFDYGGKMTAIVRASKFRRSPLPQGGLEIPITLMVSQGDTTSQILVK